MTDRIYEGNKRWDETRASLQPEYAMTGTYCNFEQNRPKLRGEIVMHHWAPNCPECGQDLRPSGEVKPILPKEEGPWELIDTKLDMYHKIVWIWRKIK